MNYAILNAFEFFLIMKIKNIMNAILSVLSQTNSFTIINFTL